MPACWFDDTMMPSRVQASMSMCGNTLRWLMGEEQITHLGAEYYEDAGEG